MSGDRGVAELASDEAATRGLIDRLRALPPEGAEPDWAALERSIRDAVGHDVPRPWWRRLRWLAPTVTLVTASAVLLLALWPRPATVSIPVANPPSERASATGRDAEHDSHVPDEVVALWLDGAEVDVDLSSDALGEAAFGEREAATAEADEVGLLPATDLAWVDELDAAALSRAERWLADTGKGNKG